MRYRKESPTGDYIFGTASVFLVNTPETVAQAVRTRLRLYAKEWFLDLREGLNLDLVLGYGTQTTRDVEVQQRILRTQGVKQIIAYTSTVEARGFRVSATVDTIYGPVTINEVIR